MIRESNLPPWVYRGRWRLGLRLYQIDNVSLYHYVPASVRGQRLSAPFPRLRPVSPLMFGVLPHRNYVCGRWASPRVLAVVVCSGRGGEHLADPVTFALFKTKLLATEVLLFGGRRASCVRWAAAFAWGGYVRGRVRVGWYGVGALGGGCSGWVCAWAVVCGVCVGGRGAGVCAGWAVGCPGGGGRPAGRWCSPRVVSGRATLAGHGGLAGLPVRVVRRRSVRGGLRRAPALVARRHPRVSCRVTC